jgi:hypothetical protein
MGADAAPAGVIVMPGASLVNVERVESGVDLERAVQRALDRRDRDAKERG